MLKRQARPGWMAIDLRPARVRLAHVVRTPAARPRLVLLKSFERAGGDAGDLARLRRAVGLQHYRCTTAIEPGAYQIVQTNAPAVPATERNAALRWSVKDSLDFPVDAALIDSLDVPADGAPAGRAPLVLAVAARRERVRAQVQAFQQSGVPLKVVDIAETAQRNVAALFEQPDRALAMLSFDEAGGLLTFTRNGELYATRRIDATADALADEAPADARELLYERIGLELQRSLDNFDRLFSQLALHRVIVAPLDGRDALIAHLRQNLTPPVEPAELDNVIDRDDEADLGDAAAQAHWLRGIGLALREEAVA